MLSAAILCMAEAIYFEARSESIGAKLAVGYTIKNRSNLTNNTICEVVHEKDQFTYYWDGKPENVYEHSEYEKILGLATLVIHDTLPDLTFGATHFDSLSVRPKYADKSTVRVFDKLYFYKVTSKTAKL